MGHREVYFRIDSRYQGYDGWPAAKDEFPFKEESRSLFQEAGWTLQVGQRSCVSDTVTKGQQDLYLHPMNFSGVMLEEDIPLVEALLAQAKTFRCRGVDLYAEYFDMDDEAYWTLLESKRDEITAEVLARCKTKRSNLYRVGGISMGIADQFSVRRICDKAGHRNKAYKFVSELIDQLISEGQLVTAKTKSGFGIRTATAKERKRQMAG